MEGHPMTNPWRHWQRFTLGKLECAALDYGLYRGALEEMESVAVIDGKPTGSTDSHLYVGTKLGAELAALRCEIWKAIGGHGD
jgi:hypothetical protein